jgi:hypothetical protein
MLAYVRPEIISNNCWGVSSAEPEKLPEVAAGTPANGIRTPAL